MPHDLSPLPHLSQISLLDCWPHGAMPSGDTHPTRSLPSQPLPSPTFQFMSLPCWGGTGPVQLMCPLRKDDSPAGH